MKLRSSWSAVASTMRLASLVFLVGSTDVNSMIKSA